MPEIKNAFLKGKMNKDLDERLIPNGEYRDALNVDVDYSEGSDVGALKNILGTNLVGKIPQVDNTTILGNTGTCIGSVKDTKENKIYWLIHDSQFVHPINGTFIDRDIIAEYDCVTGALAPVIVEWANSTSALKFNTSFRVTGINVLDGVLYFTDNLNEPKQIDIAYWKTQSTNFVTNTTGLSEERITVIKKSPLVAPSLTMSSSTRGGPGTQGGATVLSANDFSANSHGNTLNDAKNSGVTVTGNFNIVPTNYAQGDVIKFTHEFTDPNNSNVKTTVEARILLTSYPHNNSGFQFEGEILTISENVPGLSVNYTALLEEDDPLFELKFPLFSYRYKYNNNQYSCFAPFSKAAFLPDSTKVGDNFEYDSKKGFNVGMTNTLRSLELTGLNHNISADVDEIDIIYKDTLSNNVYIADTIKRASNGSIASTFVIKNEQIFKTVEANQLLRLFDSVPKKALSQEISANRVIYGNYTQNFNLNDDPTFEIKLKNRYNPTSTDSAQMLSLKSNRTYQLGVVGIDTYGRQTPVLTDKTGIINIPFDQAKNRTQFSVKTTFPGGGVTGISNYKYFIKEISSITHNLCADSFYQDDEGAIYISFPSSEINKVKEEDILVLKKQAGNKPSVGGSKFKVLDKLTTVPEFLARPLREVYGPEVFNFGRMYDLDGSSGSNEFTSDPGGFLSSNYGKDKLGGVAWYMQPGSTPVPKHNTIIVANMYNVGNAQITDPSNTSHFNSTSARGVSLEAIEQLKVGAKIEFKAGDAKSKVYTVKHIQVATPGHDDIEVTFEEEFGDDVLICYDAEDQITNPHTAALVQGVVMSVLDFKDESGKPEYDGKFFIKLEAETNLLNELVDTTDVNNLRALGTLQFDGVDDGSNHNRQMFIRAGGKKNTNSASSNNISPANGGFQGITGATLSDGFHFMIESEDGFSNASGMYGTIPALRGLKEGNYLRLSGYDDKTNPDSVWFDEHYYKIEKVTTAMYGSTKGFFVKLSQDLEYDLTFNGDRGNNFLTTFDFDQSKRINITNPPIFEVEPKDDVDIDIYYETKELFTSGQLGNFQDLDYHNCYSFANGVESFTIRDDFNAPSLGKGVRVSTVFEDNYQEDNLKSGLIYSQVYNGKTGINRLNQFIIADKITKDLNPEYGSIQKLFARDTDVLALCEDKVVKILANKDAVFNADGNPQLIASNRVLGQAIIPATFGSYGISKNPESFVDFTYRSYFVDKVRGVVLRLSADGITEVSNYGMKDYFKDNLRAQTGYIYGMYDETKNQYNVALPQGTNSTASYSESINGWVSRKSYIPEGGVSINNKYYTFKNGSLYEHHSTSGTRNKFHNDSSATPSEVTFVFNESPANIKNFRTLNYEGDDGWTCQSITTEQQDGAVASFVEKENKYYNYISGVEETESTVDIKALNVQGLGAYTSQAVVSSNRVFTFNFELNNDIQIGDKLYYLDGSNVKQDLGKITAISKANKTVTIVNTGEVPQASAFMFYVKNALYNTSGILGYHAEVKMQNSSANLKELYSVGSEISISS
tara:strand:+ start:1715 stop:6277 length:4563 start_codon:yes stop_codon:yes gene_type:complete